MAPSTRRKPIPKQVRELPLGGRIRWARKSAGLSHDRLVAAIGRSNRGHLIKIEAGTHVPKSDLRDAIADATGVPRDLFTVEDEEDSRGMSIDDLLMRRLRQMMVAAEREALV